MSNKVLTAHFSSSGHPASGLSPTITIFQVGATSSITIVTDAATTEIGSGWYSYAFSGFDPRQDYVFTFDGGATLSAHDRYKVGGNEGYVEDIASQVWEESAISHTATDSTGLMLNQIKADTASVVINEAMMVSLLNNLLKYERNRTKIDMDAAQLVIYDDDCTTPLMRFNLLDFHGMPSVTEVCERIPVTCGTTGP